VCALLPSLDAIDMLLFPRMDSLNCDSSPAPGLPAREPGREPRLPIHTLLLVDGRRLLPGSTNRLRLPDRFVDLPLVLLAAAAVTSRAPEKAGLWFAISPAIPHNLSDAPPVIDLHG
jgi:hypothetical protein